MMESSRDCLLFCLFLSLSLFVSLSDTLNGKPKLVFNEKGVFKLAVFADLHYGEAEDTSWGPQQDIKSTGVMNKMLVMEQPDFVVYSGDQITGNNIQSNGTDYWAKLVDPCVKTSTNWAVVFGNHDDLSVSGGTREDLLIFDSKFINSYSEFGPAGLHGLTNYYLLIYSNETSVTPSWVVYMLDSGGGTLPELVYEDQIEWLVKTSREISSKFGAIPAIAFFHIPSTGYQSLYAEEICSGTNNDTVAPQIKPNDLLFTLFSHANVKLTIVGHNHGNDWCCPYKGKYPGYMICFARHTGYGGYGTWMRGSRMVVLKDGAQYETHVRMEDGRVEI